MAQVSGTIDSSGMSSERTQAGDDPESRVPSETDALNVKHIDLEAGGASSEGGSDADVEKKQTPAVFSAKPKPNLGSGMRLLTLARPEWNMMLVATVALVITQLGSMAVPWYFGKLIDCITDQSIDISARRSQMRDIVIQLLVILIIASMTLFVRGAIYNAAGERVVARLRIRLFRAILGQEIAFFDSNKTGELLSRLSSDTSKIQDAATTSVSMFLRTCIGLAISLIMLFVTSWKLTLVLCLVVPIIVGCAVTYGRFVKRVAKRYQDALAKAADVSNESIANIRTCRSFAAEDVEINKYRRLIGDPDDASDKLLGWMPKAETTYKLGIYKSLGHGGFLGIIGGVGQIALAGLLWYGGELVISGEITSGKLITFMMYALQVAMSLAVFASLFSSFMEAIGASARTFEIIDRVPALSLRGGQPVGKLNGHVEFENVSFRYPTRPDVVVLDNISLDIAANTTVALVGQSGGGKSTCISLLERFYEVTAGAIKVDGRDIRTIDPSELRHAMGLVSQEPVLFGVSILENICYGSSTQVTASSDPDVSKYGVPFERVVEVAKMANAYDFIMQFPEGFNTLVGERGIKLSGGQKQRIAIARSLLINPSILLLDEATSALDAQSEELVQDAIEKIMVGRTTIVVAHRLSTIKNADKIVMIKDHRIVDQGRHEELMARCSEYHELVKKQLSKAER